MRYTLTLNTFEEVSDQARREAERRYRRALEAALGGASLVLPTHAAWQRIVATHGDSPDPKALTPAEREVLDQWQAAEAAAVTAAFGPHRYMDDARFEIGACDRI